MADARTERWVEHRVQVREQLVDAAIRAVDRIGPHASMQDIADEAGVPKPALYRSFDSKSDLAAAIADRARLDTIKLISSSRQSGTQTLAELIDTGLKGYVALISEHSNIFRFLLYGTEAKTAYGYKNSLAIANEITGMLFVANMLWGGDQTKDLTLYGSMILGVVTGAAAWWFESDIEIEQVTAEEFYQKIRSPIYHIIEQMAAEAGAHVDYEKLVPMTDNPASAGGHADSGN